MKIGINWTDPNSTSLIKKLTDESHIDFCELLIDNFLFIDPYQIQDFLGGAQNGFHIMQSRYMTRNFDELKSLASKIKNFVKILKPIYVSEHIIEQTYKGKELPSSEECDYQNNGLFMIGKCRQWQEMLDQKILFENFPSLKASGLYQISFFETLLNEINCGVLFDVSNAVVSSSNIKIELHEWKKLYLKCEHFHIGGHRKSETWEKYNSNMLFDTHDTVLSDVSVSFMNSIFQENNSVKSVIIERDDNRDESSIKHDIQKIRNIYA